MSRRRQARDSQHRAAGFCILILVARDHWRRIANRAPGVGDLLNVDSLIFRRGNRLPRRLVIAAMI
jgi:hypothetical protein